MVLGTAIPDNTPRQDTPRQGTRMHPTRGIDHLVLAVRDLETARARYASWGFTLTPMAQHPFGTANSLVQLDGNFLELLAIDDPARIPPAPPSGFSFGAFNREFLNRREGFSMLVFESRDARADHRDFAAAGLDAQPPFDFSRDARLPDGSKARVGFSLAFVTDPRLPEAAFFTCQQHAPQHFWKPEYQRHANSARQVVEVVMVASAPAELRGLFAGMQGADAVAQVGDGLTVRTARGKVSVLTPAAFDQRFPGAAPASRPATPHLAAFVVRVDDLGAVKRPLIPAAEAFGTVIAFTAG
jgi:hypothetical protein